jgi:hypothetical protein
MIEKVTIALNDIGIECLPLNGAKGFVDGVQIKNGKIFYCPIKATPSNILHEAGHLAIIPNKYRGKAQDNLSAVMSVMAKEIDFSNPDIGDARAFMQCGDTEATAWAYAFGKRIGLSEKLIIDDKDYDGSGATIRIQLKSSHYMGINGLAAAGFCARPGMHSHKPSNIYPNLSKWLQN